MLLTPAFRTALPVVLTFVLAFGVGVAGASLLRTSDDDPAVSHSATAANPTPAVAVTPNGSAATPAPTQKSAAPAAAPKPKAQPALVPAGGRASFAAQVGGTGVAAAVAPVGSGVIQTFGDPTLTSNPGGAAWSTMKLALVTQLLRDRGGASRLTADDRREATAALTASDNPSAAAIFDTLKSRHGGLIAASDQLAGLLREAGDATTTVSTSRDGNPNAISTWGQTAWPLAATTRFVRALARGCLLPTGDTRYVEELMAAVSAERGWGIGGAQFARHVAFKGGWGREAGGQFDARQVGLVGSGASAAVVAVFARGATQPDAFARATTAARWVRDHLRKSSRPAGRCGG